MKINHHTMGKNSPCYIIAEIGHNHQGDDELAMELISAAAHSGASAVKFQKRDNQNLFTKEFYEKAYTGSNSFGSTYGEHREFLEPKIALLQQANKLAHALGIDFIVTVFDEASLVLCENELKVDAYKIQSADLTHHGLIRTVALTQKPYFISCGAASYREVLATVSFCNSLETPYCMMYAVSEYPTSDNHVNLFRIAQLIRESGLTWVGFSCHHKSIEPALLSRAIGAVAIEKHFTLDKNQRGPDHHLSILPDELFQLREQLASVDSFMGNDWTNQYEVEDYQLDARYKMGKCAVAKKDLEKGHFLQATDIEFRSPMKGKSPMEVTAMIGKPLILSFRKGDVL